MERAGGYLPPNPAPAQRGEAVDNHGLPEPLAALVRALADIAFEDEMARREAAAKKDNSQ